MKKFILLLFSLTLTTIINAENISVAISIVKQYKLPSGEFSNSDKLVDICEDLLIQKGKEKYQIVNTNDAIDELVKREFERQGSGLVNENELIEKDKRIAVQQIIGIIVSFNEISKDYLFRAKVIDVEKGSVVTGARYPEGAKKDPVIKFITVANAEIVCNSLLQKMGLLKEENIDIKEISHIVNNENEWAKKLIQESQRAKKNKERRNNARTNAKNFWEPYYSWELYGGYAPPSGGKFAIQFCLKYVSIGVGLLFAGKATGRNGNFYDNSYNHHTDLEKFPINNSPDGLPHNYEFQPVALNLSVGLNFKYFGFSLQPEFHFLNKTIYTVEHEYSSNTYEYYDAYVVENYPSVLVSYTPSVYFHIPVTKDEVFGLSGRIGYSFAPTIKYNPGLSAELGICVFWGIKK